jgi:hypothetical protein
MKEKIKLKSKRIPITIGIMGAYLIASVRFNLDMPMIPSLKLSAKENDLIAERILLDKIIEWCGEQKNQIRGLKRKSKALKVSLKEK